MSLHTLLIATLLCACGTRQATAPAPETAGTEADSASLEETAPAVPQGTLYQKEDSLCIEKLLRQAQSLRKEENRMLFFGRAFTGIPYVAHTLEKGEGEMLVVNTREMDCTTFVETCAALTLADERDIRTFAGFCRLLEQLRYRGGKRDGYPSRLHYSTQWIADNETLGYFQEITHEGTPFTAVQVMDIHYMSQHPDKYTKLTGRPDEVEIIRLQENEEKGKQVRYIPKRLLNGTPEELADVHDGDILALVTAQDGLDNSHLGLAVWQDGKLHLLNASSLHKAVWTDPASLYDYSKNKKNNLGIRVVRIR